MDSLRLVNQDTICAIATPAGEGGLAVLRVSGPEAISIVDRLFRSVGGKQLHEWPAYRSGYGSVRYEGGEVLDDVVATLFRSPHSFTGEDTVELACHGSLYIQEQLLRLLIGNGCRMAEPGEFSKRAFLNGRLDLSQAEAVADIISARSAQALRLARKQADGSYSAAFNALADKLIELTALLELELDFSEEDVEFADRSTLIELCSSTLQRIEQLITTYSAGNAVKEGVAVAIVGPANAGKSTLLNTLLGRDRAIVSDTAGTTRDTVEDSLRIGGILFRLVDTAGIRSTEDKIEQIGIERSFAAISEANIILYVLDGRYLSQLDREETNRLCRAAGETPVLLLLNKSDLATPAEDLLPEELRSMKRICLAAKKGEGIELLKQELLQLAQLPEGSNDIIVSNTRHYQALLNAAEALRRVVQGLEDGISSDFLSPDLRACIDSIEEISGRRIGSDTVLHHIFSHFCIGK